MVRNELVHYAAQWRAAGEANQWRAAPLVVGPARSFLVDLATRWIKLPRKLLLLAGVAALGALVLLLLTAPAVTAAAAAIAVLLAAVIAALTFGTLGDGLSFFDNLQIIRHNRDGRFL